MTREEIILSQIKRDGLGSEIGGLRTRCTEKAGFFGCMK